MALDLAHFSALTFDCYGTLIDWETGIHDALGGLLCDLGADVERETLLAAFARHESAVEAGPFLAYREVLARVAEAVCRENGVTPTGEQLAAFGGSVGAWPPFEDSADALARLATRYRLGVITNCDDDLFAASNLRLGVAFDPVVTAQQVGSYKPATRNFDVALERLGLPRDRILHVAQSLFHDHVPAKRLGLATVWVDRRRGQAGSGATPDAEAAPDLTVPDMATLADLASST